MAALVADTSAWVAYLGGETIPLLEAGLAAGIVHIPALVITELLGNDIPRRERHELEEMLSSLPILGTDAAHHSRAGAAKAELAKKGIGMSARDAHIFQCALDVKGVLVTRDPLFQHPALSSLVPVQVW